VNYLDYLFPSRRVFDMLRSLSAQLLQMEIKFMSALDNLRAQVEANTTVTESAITLLNGLKAKLDEAIASGDPAALQALADELGAETLRLSDAVVAITLA
jgi:hypothetical protein